MDKAHSIDMKTIGNGSGSSGYGGVDGTLSSSSSGSTISPAVDNNHRRWGSEINSSENIETLFGSLCTHKERVRLYHLHCLISFSVVFFLHVLVHPM